MNKLFLICCLYLLSNSVQAQLPAPEYHKGKATLSGKIVNYKPSNNLDFRIGAPNIVMHAAETLYPTIEADGSFSVAIPLYHSSQIRLLLGKADKTILMSPDKETTVTIDFGNPPGKQFIYGGEHATINNELEQPELKKGMPIIYRDGDRLDAIVDISANEFKRRCIDEYKKEVTHNDAQQQFGESARTLANLMCAFACLHNLQATRHCLQTAHQKKHNLSREQAFAAFRNLRLPDDYYDCLDSFPVNHPLALYCYNYRDALMTDYITYSDEMESQQYLLDHAPLTKDEQSLIGRYKAVLKEGIPFQQYEDLMALSIKYKKESEQYHWQRFTAAKENLSRILKDSTCLLVDRMRTIFTRSNLYNHTPLTPRQEMVAAGITNPILRGIVFDMNQQMQPRKKVTQKKSIVCEAPQVPEKELLSALIARHKGKVQFIDFWATWCGGCRQIIKEYEPLKKEMTEDKVAFVYLTGPSSVAKTWNILIPDIEGEHYWLNKEQWNYLWADFKMQGLPMYLLIDKQGNIVKKFVHMTANELKVLLQQEINK